MIDLSYLPLYSKVPSMLLKEKWIQRLGFTEIRDLQNKRLRVLIKHSYDHVPYYHSLFKKANLHPEDIKTVDDLKKIPISKKTDMRDLPIKYLTANNIDLSNCWVARTSGSSGIPFTIYREKEAKLHSQVQHYLLQLRSGQKLSDKRVIIGAAWVPPPPNLVQKAGILRTKNISPLNPPKIQLEEILDFNTNTLIAPPSCMVPLAKEIKEADFKDFQISLLFTGGELLHDSLRHFLIQTFNSEVFDSYGATEGGVISQECREHHYHIHSNSVFIEATKHGTTLAPNEEGEITVTNFDKLAQPFIRYNLEDFGMLLEEKCSCGSNFPMMKLTSGRVSNLIHLPDGTALSAHEVNWFLTVMPAIKQYQVIQEASNRLVVKLVKAQGFQENTITDITQTFHKRLGPDIEVNVLLVDNIPRESSRKFILFKSNVSTIVGS